MKVWIWLVLAAVVFFAVGFQVKAAQVAKGSSTPS